MKFNSRIIYLTLFAILYLAVASVSTLHAVSFFGLANADPLAILLAVTFEIGQAAVLFSILTSSKERSKIMPWCLMGILTLVQILGNVFSSYKYLILNSNEDLRFFKEPIFIWMDLPDQQCNVILTYIIGAIMPIIALCLTSMVTNYLTDTAQPKIESKPEPEPAKEQQPEVTEDKNDLPLVDITELSKIDEEDSENDVNYGTSNEVQEETVDEDPIEFEHSRQSHFINLKK